MGDRDEKPVEEKKKAKAKKGKKPHVNKPTSKKYSMYTISESKILRSSMCPRCGPGVFLAKHSGRLHCGKCNYTEFKKS